MNGITGILRKKLAGEGCAFAAMGVLLLNAALGDRAISVKRIAFRQNASAAIAFFAPVARFTDKAAIGTDDWLHIISSFL